MMLVDNVSFQLIDTPPISKEFMEPQLLGLIRKTDLILLVIDLQADPILVFRDHSLGFPDEATRRRCYQRAASLLP